MPTTSLCSICLSKMWVTVGTMKLSTKLSTKLPTLIKTKVFNLKQLKCGHIFHRDCIDMVYEPICPLCRIYLVDEELMEKVTKKLLKHPSSLEVKKMVEPLPKEFIHELLKRIVEKNNPDIVKQVLRVVNPSSLLMEAIEKKDEKMVELLAQSRKINWDQTFQGKTLLEHSVCSGNEVIANLVLDKSGLFICHCNSHIQEQIPPTHDICSNGSTVVSEQQQPISFTPSLLPATTTWTTQSIRPLAPYFAQQQQQYPSGITPSGITPSAPPYPW